MPASGASTALTPPAIAIVHSSLARLWQARCSATKPDEQAVSTVRLGPRKSSTYDTRFATTLAALPVP
jgi:hypothetical protein